MYRGFVLAAAALAKSPNLGPKKIYLKKKQKKASFNKTKLNHKNQENEKKLQMSDKDQKQSATKQNLLKVLSD